MIKSNKETGWKGASWVLKIRNQKHYWKGDGYDRTKAGKWITIGRFENKSAALRAGFELAYEETLTGLFTNRKTDADVAIFYRGQMEEMV